MTSVSSVVKSTLGSVMAGFKMHVSTSSLLGCGYAAAGYAYGMPPDTSLVAGAICGFSGMLPDLDSDYGTPLRETMCFTSATIPMLLLDRFTSLGLRHDEIVLLAVTLYLFMRFGVTNMIRKYTVHRGMFHSIPACLIFTGLAFLICGTSDLNVRYFKSGGVILGFMSHLILDEIYSVEWKSGRWRLKKSSGTAIKFWGDDAWANFSCYAKLIVVAAMVVGEPSVMRQLQARNPNLAQTYQELQNQYQNWSGNLMAPGSANSSRAGVNAAPRSFLPQQQPGQFAPQSYQTASPGVEFPTDKNHSPNYASPGYTAPVQVPATSGQSNWDTAQRPMGPYPQ